MIYIKKSTTNKKNKKHLSNSILAFEKPRVIKNKVLKSKANLIIKRGKRKPTTNKSVVTPKVPAVKLPSVVPVVEDVKSKRAKKSPIMYFTQDTEDAVVAYNAEVDQEIRNDIYNTRIKHSFEKLVENVFNTFKFTYFETGPIEMQQETVAHLVSNIEKYNPEKGKAFSYFSIVSKHYLIFHNNNNYKRFNQNVSISDTPSETTVCLQVEDSYYKTVEMREFMSMMIIYWEKNIGRIFSKQRDLNIANAVVELFRNSDRIDAFNKKALYLYIREISSCKTQQITKVINKMKTYQTSIRGCYLDNGVLQQDIYKNSTL